MTRANPDQFMPLRHFLSRHPAVIEVTRVTADLTDHLAQVVVFEKSWAYVVAASGGEILQPRRLVRAEVDLLEGDGYVNADDDGDQIGAVAMVGPEVEASSFPIKDSSGEIVGALTVFGPNPTDGMSLDSLARIVTGLIVSESPAEAHRIANLDPLSIIDGLRDVVIVINEDFEVRWVNAAVGSLFGRSQADVIGRNVSDFIHPDDMATALDAAARIVSGLTIYRVIVRLGHADGSWSRVEVTGTDQTENPNIGGIVLSLRSSELELEIEQAQRRIRNMSESMVEQMYDGIVATDDVGAITLVNRAAQKLFGIPADTPPGRLTWQDFPLLDSRGSVVPLERHPARVLFGAEFEPSDEMSIVSHRGDHHYVSVTQRTVVGADGTLQGSFVAFHDVTETREAQYELVSQALHDQLTGLPNRRMLNEYLASLGPGTGPLIAACFIDLDAFKLINDTHGHRTGDQVIRMSAERLAAVLRQQDLLVRQGGDEFVVILDGVKSEEAAKAIARRILACLSDPFMIDGLRFDIAASAGVALARSDELDSETLLRHADIALYAAKARGRNRVELFDGDLEVATEVAEHQRRMLRYALDNDGIVMHFQPLIDSRTGKAHGFEALARCIDSDGNLHGPSSFLESIDGSGLIWELDQRAFKLSCAAAAVMAATSRGEDRVVACNFSPLSIVQPEFVTYVLETAKDAGVAPKNICIEITESAAFSGGAASIEAVTRLGKEGFLVALDDFGTGYSSLSHLRDLPLASVKVDRSFVAKLTEQGPERAIAEAVVGLADDLGLGIVAEGVETKGQLNAAEDVGFHLMQGWHYAAAMPLDELLHRWIRPEAAGLSPIPDTTTD